MDAWEYSKRKVVCCGWRDEGQRVTEKAVSE